MQEVRGSSPRISTKFMTPHNLQSTAEAPEHQWHFRAIRNYGTALLAGVTFFGASPAGADTSPSSQPQPAPDGGTAYVSSSGDQLNTCISDFDFRVGIQDDNQFVWQQNISRNKAFSLATKTFGASVLRINVIYGMVQKYGLQQYKDAVISATKHGYQTQVTILPTPAYQQSLSQKLSDENYSPAKMEHFAYRVAKKLGPRVVRYSIMNEPNSSLFFKGSLKSFDALFEAGRDGVLEANHHAQIAVGELSDNNLKVWFNNIENLPANDIDIHGYGRVLSQTNTLAEKARRAGKTLLISEYGVGVGRNQLLKDKHAIKVAACGDAGELVFYQLIRDPKASWDTGIYNPPKNSHSTTKH